jgi:SAM-dependent methyltransferase
MIDTLRDISRSLRERVSPPEKEVSEMSFWRSRARAEKLGVDGVAVLQNAHYERAFTSHFELPGEEFTGKRVLDIGCGPRGSLEWAHDARERVGLDPLVDQYREFGIDTHAMTYVGSGAEHIPFDDGHFDIVCALNSLDHVEDLDATIHEISRVTADGGLVLLTVEVRHKPTAAEPHWLDWDIGDRFPECAVEWSARNGVRWDHDLFRSIDHDVDYRSGRGILRARLRRQPRSA